MGFVSLESPDNTDLPIDGAAVLPGVLQNFPHFAPDPHGHPLSLCVERTAVGWSGVHSSSATRLTIGTTLKSSHITSENRCHPGHIFPAPWHSHNWSLNNPYGSLLRSPDESFTLCPGLSMHPHHFSQGFHDHILPLLSALMAFHHPQGEVQAIWQGLLYDVVQGSIPAKVHPHLWKLPFFNFQLL